MKILKKNNNICVLGGGLWGAVLANHLARGGAPVRLWEFFPDLAHALERTRRHPYIPELELAPSVRVGSDLAEAARDADPVVCVLPSAHVRRTAGKVRAALDGRHPFVVNASKGVEPGTLRTMGEILEEELPESRGRVYALSGPSFAREVARGVPTGLVLAGPPGPGARRLLRIFDGGALKVELSADRKGVELGGALKNVLAVGCGILDGLGAGANSKAAFMVLAVREMARLIRASGGREATVYGLAGLGDLVATGTSPESRNRALGEKLGRGKSLQAALKEIPTVAEGAESARSARELARARRVPSPLVEAVWRVVHDGAKPRTVLEAMGFEKR